MIDEITRHLNSKSDKVELKAEKIELGLIDDFNKKLDGLKNMDKYLTKVYSSAYKVWADIIDLERRKSDSYNDLSDAVEDSESVIKEVSNEFEKVVKAAKELGINPTEIKGLTESVKLVENMEDNLNQSKQILPDLKK